MTEDGTTGDPDAGGGNPLGLDDEQVTLTRRALVAVALGGGVAGLSLSSARSFLERFAPLSGSVWRSATRSLSGTVESPYGAATLGYDDRGVPHVRADDERALYFAAGYAQANDRLFQMDAFRRRMRGRLSELAGPGQVDTDRFHLQMDFVGAAETTWEAGADTRPGEMARAFTDGVNAFRENERLPFEFRAAEYEPDPWTPVDTILQQKQISWGLSGRSNVLRAALVREELGAEAVERLYPDRYEFDAPILQDDAVGDGTIRGRGPGGPDASAADPDAPAATDPDPPGATDAGPGGEGGELRPGRATRPGHDGGVDGGLARWIAGFEWPEGIGSNSWLIGPEHTDVEGPIVCNDTHLQLTAPPIWYEMHLDGPDHSVRGYTLPGVPFVIVGQNEHGAWGFTNSNVDALDYYEYETVDGGSGYRYDGGTREFDVEEREIPVSGGEDRTATVRKSVHGPVLERDGARVGLSWVGHTATRTTRAAYRLTHSEGLADVREAMRMFDEPSQNFVYGDADGRTFYLTTGKVPVRRTDGEVVRGDRVFDGSAAEGEWAGFEPFGESDLDGPGFLDYEEKPAAIDPEYVLTANQRILDDPAHYLAEGYSDPFRGIRGYELLDRRVASDDPVTVAFAKDLHRDELDLRGRLLGPAILDARDRMTDRAAALAGELEGWDYRMRPDARPPLVLERFFRHFRRAAFADDLRPAAAARDEGEAALGAGDEGDPGEVTDDEVADFFPSRWVTATLEADSDFFEGDRAAVIAAAMDATAAELDEEGWETYGDYATADFSHPLGSVLPFLDYPAVPVPGSGETLRNFHPEAPAGTSQRLVATPGDPSRAEGVLPGGNSGDYFTPNYTDQLRDWAAGEYRSLALSAPDDVVTEFVPEG